MGTLSYLITAEAVQENIDQVEELPYLECTEAFRTQEKERFIQFLEKHGVCSKYDHCVVTVSILI